MYEKIGFVYEGTRRQPLHWDGELIDAHTMSILANEWLAHPLTSNGPAPAIQEHDS